MRAAKIQDIKILKAKRNPWLEGFELLAPHADLSVLTPIFQCHLLHFAVATLDLSLIRHVIDTMGGPAAAQAVSPTALGHTLLHIASLPIDDSVVNTHSQKIYLSIHEFRTTDEKWVPQRLLTTPPPDTREMGRGGLARNQLERQDIYGNTLLHYLVSDRNPDYKLIEKLQDFSEQSVDVWGVRNVYGFSAEDLDSENRAAKAHYSELDHPSFWNDDNNENR
ncbi:hypothetical protein N7490_000857 [Penicillium lividum]|nr:hypothetical protein N7490_000857 [Penicillium lividum]